MKLNCKELPHFGAPGTGEACEEEAIGYLAARKASERLNDQSVSTTVVSTACAQAFAS